MCESVTLWFLLRIGAAVIVQPKFLYCYFRQPDRWWKIRVNQSAMRRTLILWRESLKDQRSVWIICCVLIFFVLSFTLLWHSGLEIWHLCSLSLVVVSDNNVKKNYTLNLRFCIFLLRSILVCRCFFCNVNKDVSAAFAWLALVRAHCLYSRGVWFVKKVLLWQSQRVFPSKRLLWEELGVMRDVMLHCALIWIFLL